jgi:hypothetical protein
MAPETRKRRCSVMVIYALCALCKKTIVPTGGNVRKGGKVFHIECYLRPKGPVPLAKRS